MPCDPLCTFYILRLAYNINKLLFALHNRKQRLQAQLLPPVIGGFSAFLNRLSSYLLLFLSVIASLRIYSRVVRSEVGYSICQNVGANGVRSIGTMARIDLHQSIKS